MGLKKHMWRDVVSGFKNVIIKKQTFYSNIVWQSLQPLIKMYLEKYKTKLNLRLQKKNYKKRNKEYGTKFDYVISK